MTKPLLLMIVLHPFCTAVFSQSNQYAQNVLAYSRLRFEQGGYPDSRKAGEIALQRLDGQPDSPLRREILLHLSAVEMELGNFRRADSLAAAAAERASSRQAVRGKAPAKALSQRGHCLALLARYAPADSLLRRAASLQQNARGAARADYALTLDRMGLNLMEQRKFEDAEAFYLRAKKIRQTRPGKSSLDYAASLEHLGELYLETERLEAAIIALTEAFTITQHHPFKANVMNTMGRVRLAQGDIEAADTLFQASAEMQRRTGVAGHSHFAKTLGNQADLLTKLGNFEAAAAKLEEAGSILRSSLSEKHPDYAINLVNLGNLLDDSLAIPLYHEAAGICRELGIHNLYFRAKHNVADRYKYSGDYEQALLSFEDLLKDTASQAIEDDYVQAILRLNYAETLWFSGNPQRYALADSVLRVGEKLYRRVASDKNLEYLLFNTGLAEISELKGDLASAAAFFEKNCRLQIEMFGNLYPSLNEEERLLFFEAINDYNVRLISFLKRYPTPFPNLNKAALELRMTVKGASMNLNVANRLLSLTSGDSLLTILLEKLQAAKRKMASEFQQLNTNKEALKSSNVEIKQLEKELSRRSRDIGRRLEQAPDMSFEDIRQALADTQALVDFIRLPDFNPFTQEVERRLFCAFVVRNSYDVPRFEVLAEEPEVVGALRVNPASRGSYLQNPAINHRLAQQLWAPLEQHLAGAKQVFLCPEGALHSIAFHALRCDSLSGQLLVEKYDLRLRLSPGDLLRNSRQSGAEKIAAIFGGCLFDSTAVAEEDDSTRGAYFHYLPGSLKETVETSTQLKEAGWQVAAFTGRDASESNLRKLDAANAPFILHLATHGFFFPKNPMDDVPAKSFEDRLRSADDPMFRSGIALTGANITWKGAFQADPAADGILTAFEVSGMNLWQTELAVLSSCESGKGDLVAQEGAFGLQRAFRQAGVRSSLVSLWKVSDKETAQFMHFFYQSLLAGASPADSLRKAQLEMRLQKPEAFFWAGFVLME